jgi:hypothetical protein
MSSALNYRLGHAQVELLAFRRFRQSLRTPTAHYGVPQKGSSRETLM